MRKSLIAVTVAASLLGACAATQSELEDTTGPSIKAFAISGLVVSTAGIALVATSDEPEPCTPRERELLMNGCEIVNAMSTTAPYGAALMVLGAGLGLIAADLDIERDRKAREERRRKKDLPDQIRRDAAAGRCRLATDALHELYLRNSADANELEEEDDVRACRKMQDARARGLLR